MNEYTSINERLEDNNWKLVYDGPSSEWYKKGNFVITVKDNDVAIFKTNEHVKDEDFSVYTSVKLLSNCLVVKK